MWQWGGNEMPLQVCIYIARYPWFIDRHNPIIHAAELDKKKKPAQSKPFHPREGCDKMGSNRYKKKKTRYSLWMLNLFLFFITIICHVWFGNNKKQKLNLWSNIYLTCTGIFWASTHRYYSLGFIPNSFKSNQKNK